MSVRAKFKLNTYESSLDQRMIDPAKGYEPNNYEVVEKRTLIFNPVYGNGDPNHENTKFWQYTPTGEVRLGVVNQEAWKYFELGKEYYLDFVKAE